MKNITNQIITLSNGVKFYIIRQAIYKGTTYFLAAKVTDNEEDFTNEIAFLEKVDKDNDSYVKVVEDGETLSVLMNNINLDEE